MLANQTSLNERVIADITGIARGTVSRLKKKVNKWAKKYRP